MEIKIWTRQAGRAGSVKVTEKGEGHEESRGVFLASTGLLSRATAATDDPREWDSKVAKWTGATFAGFAMAAFWEGVGAVVAFL